MRAAKTTPIATLAVLFAAAGVALTAAPAASAAGVPAFSIESIVTPSHLPPNAAHSLDYIVVVKNTGSAPTDGTPIEITDELPPGVSFDATSTIGTLSLADEAEIPQESLCQTGPPLRCTTPGAPIKNGVFTEFDTVVQPGGKLYMLIPIKTEAGAGPVAVNEATVSGGGAAPASVTESAPVSSEPAPFGFQAAGASLTDAEGQPAIQAASHPYDLDTHFYLNNDAAGGNVPPESLRDVHVTLPRGVAVNPRATEVRCTEAELESNDGELVNCPDASAIGIAHPAANPGTGFPSPAFGSPLYNMAPQPGVAAEFAAIVPVAGIEVLIHIQGGVNAEGRYELSASSKDITQYANPSGVDVDIWGSPTDPSHDRLRGNCASAKQYSLQLSCPVPPLDTPAITMPSACGGGLSTLFSVDSWQRPGEFINQSSPLADAEGNPVSIEGCNQVRFEPTISSKPTTNRADSPSGLDFNLHQPQEEHVEGLSTATLKDTTVALPKGLDLNPSAANGLGACTEAQIGFRGEDEEGALRFSETPQSCPGASKIGTMEVRTPLLEEKLPGSVFLAKPYENPFGSLLAIYLAVEDPKTGIVAKLAGRVSTDPNTGQLTTTVTEGPQLPLEDVTLHLFGGAGGALRTPLACATYSTTSSLVPWSTPEGATAHPTDSFAISGAAGSGSCPSSEGQAPNDPTLSAGTTSPQAGAYSPFVLKLTRAEGSAPIAGLNVTLPPGLTGRLAGIATCTDAQLAVAKAREAPEGGRAEQQSPACPQSSEVGTVTVGAGAGPTPFYAQGKAYLAGPYKSAPISLAIITPAVAGPFDLGDVLVRTPLYVNPETAQIQAVSDPIPQILDGIPLDIRSIALQVDRPNFTLNPTSCNPMSLAASVLSGFGGAANLANPFQVGGCPSLPYKPGFAARITGPTKRGKFPALKATLTAKGGEANTASLSVTLPHSEFLEQGHFGTICTRVQFAANQCPAASVYGSVKVQTPLLAYPLEGPVYLRSSSHNLPDLVLVLKGPPSQPIEIALDGRIDSKNSGIRTTFEAVPDAPFSEATLTMPGGKKGLLVNSTNVCASPNRATVRMTGQNAKTHDFNPVVANPKCKGVAHKKKQKHKRSGGSR